MLLLFLWQLCKWGWGWPFSLIDVWGLQGRRARGHPRGRHCLGKTGCGEKSGIMNEQSASRILPGILTRSHPVQPALQINMLPHFSESVTSDRALQGWSCASFWGQALVGTFSNWKGHEALCVPCWFSFQLLDLGQVTSPHWAWVTYALRMCLILTSQGALRGPLRSSIWSVELGASPGQCSEPFAE